LPHDLRAVPRQGPRLRVAPRHPRFTQPEYLADAAELITGLRELSHAEVAELMHLSDALAALNVARYAEWSQPFSPPTPAGRAGLQWRRHDGLDASTLTEAQLDFAQAHLRILSGLYGLLRPLDLMQAYRLEMGTRFKNSRGKDLYAFWGMTQTDALNRLLRGEQDAGREAVLVNLASEEYFKSVKAASSRAGCSMWVSRTGRAGATRSSASTPSAPAA
jgi:cytoplasmic iron level regulating protein YaaA (DUF328/UPF0246 family)